MRQIVIVAAIGLALVVPMAEAPAEEAARQELEVGARVYEENCASCHGVNGSPTMGGAPNFKRGQGLMQSDQDLHRRIQSGKRACPAYRGILDDQQILDVIAYIRTLF